MTVYFQHVGEAGGARDFPRTIGTSKVGLRLFRYEDVAPHLSHLTQGERDSLQRTTERYAEDGFQVWGIPSGARSVLRAFEVGDYLLLLEAAGPGGSFAYAGRAIAKPSQECFDLSDHLWGEQRFPLIVFLKGNLTSFRWTRFCESLGYSTNWNPAGQTYRIPYERLVASPFLDEDGLIRAVAGAPIELEPSTAPVEAPFQDAAELDFHDEEGRLILRQHLYRERSARLVREFKRRLVDFSCKVCGFDFEKVYGEIGRKFIEAHHTKAVSELRPGDKVSFHDLLPVCSNCHRMLHRCYPALTADKLREALSKAFAEHASN